MSTSSSGRERPTRSKRTETKFDGAKLSKRTLEALAKMPGTKRARIEAIVGRSQTPEVRAKSAADRDILDHEYRKTGRIATVSEKAIVEDSAAFSQLISRLRDERRARGLSLEQLAARSRIDKAALSRLEAGKQSNPTVATLMKYARALELRLILSLEQTIPTRSPKT
jgi:ribosome-binding protein aMBF1 (putative translation factor)